MRIVTTHGSMRIQHPTSAPISVRTRRANFFDSHLYEPKPESPRRLPAAQRAYWDEKYERAFELYDNVGDKIPNLETIAQRSAWRSFDVMNTAWPRPRMLPAPGPCIGLGRMIEYAFVDSNGDLQIRSFSHETDPPWAYWDHKHKRIYCFPHLHQESCSAIPDELQEVAGYFRQWAKRDPKCFYNLRIPRVEIVPVGMSDSITYRSDKWQDEPSQAIGCSDCETYIHDHGPGLWTWQDDDDDDQYPQAIMIHGGRLDMHPKGLIH